MTKAEMGKLQDICERLQAAETQPDYESTYRKLAAEAEAVCANDPHGAEYLEGLTSYHPKMVASRQSKARERNMSAA